MFMKKNPYEVLGVSPNMSKEEVKSRYRYLVKIYHPDKSSGDASKFIEIQQAWEELKVLGNKAFNKRVGVPTHQTLFTFRRK